MSSTDAEKRARFHALKAELHDLGAEDRAARKESRRLYRKATKAARAERPMSNQRTPRVREPLYLAWLRRLPCIAGMIEGGCEGPMEAAHLRFSDIARGRVNPGMQAKPDDRWCTALCAGHHRSDQHKRRERDFWDRLGVDAGALAIALHDAFLAGHDGVQCLRRIVGDRS
jgi:hypothetical protein